MKFRTELLLYVAALMVLIGAGMISAHGYVWVDDWEGNIPRSILPLVAASIAFAFLIAPGIFLWGVAYRFAKGEVI